MAARSGSLKVVPKKVRSLQRLQVGDLLKGVSRRDFDLVASWSVDRLGRSLIDLVSLLQELHATGVDL
jgi:DNA invertase Pin-like site-specific DNA recombinase